MLNNSLYYEWASTSIHLRPPSSLEAKKRHDIIWICVIKWWFGEEQTRVPLLERRTLVVQIRNELIHVFIFVSTTQNYFAQGGRIALVYQAGEQLRYSSWELWPLLGEKIRKGCWLLRWGLCYRRHWPLPRPRAHWSLKPTIHYLITVVRELNSAGQCTTISRRLITAGAWARRLWTGLRQWDSWRVHRLASVSGWSY